MDPAVGSADGENVLEEGISAPTPPTVLPSQEAHFLPMQLSHNSFAVLWQGQPQSTSSCVAFLGTVEMVLFGHPATTGRLCAQELTSWAKAKLASMRGISLCAQSGDALWKCVSFMLFVFPFYEAF